ncbi:GAF domain-containing protein [Barrientosiimonas marina]|uniref:GAF domain-containing protein n=1 Tax=Lentibacillus kimchii TaxID=1542911 RepID=A0ABW2UTD6_9BACI
MSQLTAHSTEKAHSYEQLLKQLTALCEDETDRLANLSNASALLNQSLGDINWIGFYLWKDSELVLGPFQGLPACIRIPYGKGVCGTAIQEGKTQRVDDVMAFPGHIACDSASKSEIVMPLYTGQDIYGVLDIDSPINSRFDETDQLYLEKFAKEIERLIQK